MKITVEIPDHLAPQFMSWMSNSGEQEFMEVISDFWDEERQLWVNNPNDVSFDYPGWKDQIVITEFPRED